MRIELALCAALATLAAGCTADFTATTAAELSTGRLPVVFDHDADFDDIAALAYLAQAHKQGAIDLRAVTVTNNGAGLPGAAIHHTRCLLEAAGLGHIPVADNGLVLGPNFPSVAIRALVQEVLTEVFATCTASYASTVQSAPALIAATVLRDPSTHVITTGPSTNLARALQLQPLLRFALRNNYAMTGALYPAEGGIEPSEWMLLYDGTAEVNAFVDPPSLDLVVRTLGTRFWMVGRDATDFVPMSAELAARLTTEATTVEGQIVAKIANNLVLQGAIAAGLPPSWWDVLAVMEGIGQPVVDFDTLPIRVITSGASSGRTEPVATGGTAIQGGLGADRALFEETFLQTLNP